MQKLGLYIHIPYCAKKCHYCAFAVTTDHTSMEAYVTKLLHDLSAAGQVAQEHSYTLSTISFGGGTPSRLPIKDLENILTTIRSSFHGHQLEEISIECNPEDVTKEYMIALRDLGFHRVSMGVQTLADATLKQIGRNHTSSQTWNALKYLALIPNWSIDLIIGLPYSKPGQTRSDLQALLPYHPPHVSLYYYTKETQSTFTHLDSKYIPNEHHVLEEYTQCAELLRSHQYRQYELSNWSRHDHVSIHNLQYWNNLPYLGVGLGAYSFIDASSLHAHRNLNTWLTSPTFFLPESKESLSSRDQAVRMLMMGLRLDTGVPLKPILDLLTDHEQQRLFSFLHSPDWEPFLHTTTPNIILTDQGRQLHSKVVSDIYNAISST